MWSNDRFSIIRTTMWSTFETRLRSAASSGTVVTPGTRRPYPRLTAGNHDPGANGRDGTCAAGGSGAAGADRPRRLPSRHRNSVDRGTKRFTSTTARTPSLAEEDESPFVGLLQDGRRIGSESCLPQSTGSSSSSPLVGAFPVMAAHE